MTESLSFILECNNIGCILGNYTLIKDDIPVRELSWDQGSNKVSHKKSWGCKGNFPLVVTNKVPLWKDTNISNKREEPTKTFHD